MLSVLVVDDHFVARHGLKQALREEFRDITFGEAATAADALIEIAKQRWEVIILDICIPETSGFQVLEEIRKKSPRARVLVLSVHAEPQYAVRAFRLGALAYVTKDAGRHEILAAFRSVLAGKKWVSASLARKLEAQPGNGPPGIWGRAGVAVSSTGHVFAETGDGVYNPAAGKFADTILALSPTEVKLSDFYTPTNREWLTRKDLDMGCMSPVVFPFRGKEYLAGGGKEGRLYLLDTAELGGDDHRTPLYRSELIVNEDVAYAAQGFWGSFATWEDAKGMRWLFAPAWGRPHPKTRPFPMTNGEAPHGSIMAFHVELKDGSPILSPAWMSRDFNVPEPPIIANGVVYALSSGEDVRQSDADGHGLNTAERLRGSTHAVLYALNSETGKELFSSGDTIASFTHFGGIALSNARVYVSTYDGFVYAFRLKSEEH